jgi:hypothetical protein
MILHVGGYLEWVLIAVLTGSASAHAEIAFRVELKPGRTDVAVVTTDNAFMPRDSSLNFLPRWDRAKHDHKEITHLRYRVVKLNNVTRMKSHSVPPQRQKVF